MDAPPSRPSLAAPEYSVTLEWRGRDLALVPPPHVWALEDDALYQALFGAANAPAMRALLTRDRRGRCLRARPISYTRLRDALVEHGACALQIAFDDAPHLPEQPQPAMTPRPYQEEALRAWRSAGYRGVVVLPTGSGKTLIGALAIAALGLRSLVVVPTIDLLRQWRDALTSTLCLAPGSVGIYGGGERDVQPITVTTYESAQLHPDVQRHFGLIIFDECHHLPAPTYRQIAEGAWTPFRLGLSATPERADDEHLMLAELIGPEVYRRHPNELVADRYLAEYEERRLGVRLSEAEHARYEKARAMYRDYVRRRRVVIASPVDFQRKILWASARDPEARAAMLAWREARDLSLNASAKLTVLEDLFERHSAERVLVFSEYNAIVDEISRRFCVPRITHKTPPEERRAILERFRDGRYSKLVSGRVLNEGVDIPDCGVAVIVSGNSTRREYVQRLGRVLRPKTTRAVLYELVTEGTLEERSADRRREFI